jgi:hypothetical protein
MGLRSQRAGIGRAVISRYSRMLRGDQVVSVEE